jgi:hypothetical protein
MKVVVTQTLNFPPDVIFAVLTDIPHHVDWIEYPVDLISLSNGPAQLGTTWKQNATRQGKKLVLVNTCNIYEKNRMFGWKTEKPYLAQVTLLLQPDADDTKITWIVESEQAGIVQLAEPLLIKQTNDMIRKSLISLNLFLQLRNKVPDDIFIDVR